MIDIIEARKLSDESSKVNKEILIQERLIDEKISEAAKNGKYEIVIGIELLPEVIEIYKINSYDVRKLEIKGDMNISSYYLISWMY